MTLWDVFLIIIPGVTFGLAIYLFITYRQLQKQFCQLLGLTAGLRMRVFEQEIRQLEAPGIFVHENAAQKLAVMLLALLSPEQQQQLHDDYNKNCPKHIPLWKYFLYQYEFTINISPRYNVGSYTSPLQIELGEVSQKISRLANKNAKIMSQLKNNLTELKSQIIEEPDTKAPDS